MGKRRGVDEPEEPMLQHSSGSSEGRARVEQLRRIGAREAMKRQPDPFDPRKESLDHYSTMRNLIDSYKNWAT